MRQNHVTMKQKAANYKDKAYLVHFRNVAKYVNMRANAATCGKMRQNAAAWGGMKQFASRAAVGHGWWP